MLTTVAQQFFINKAMYVNDFADAYINVFTKLLMTLHIKMNASPQNKKYVYNTTTSTDNEHYIETSHYTPFQEVDTSSQQPPFPNKWCPLTS